MHAKHLLGTLRSAGFTTLLAGDGLRISPSARLTPQLREEVRRHRDDLVRLLADEHLDQGQRRLRQAINRCCEVRGDDEAHRLALIEECSQLPPDERNEWRDYFDSEAHRWGNSSGGNMSDKGPALAATNGLLSQAICRTSEEKR